MGIKPLYEIGQTLYTIQGHKIKKFIVSAISIFIKIDSVSIYYKGKNETTLELYNEEHCFETKEQLIESLD